MSNVAVLSLDSRSGKWVAMYAGKILASSPNKDYVINNIRGGRCTKANNAGVTDIREVGETKVNEAGKVVKVEKFDINKRFGFLEDFVSMVADRTTPSMVVAGEGGLGKTYTVNKALKAAGLQNAASLVGVGSDDTLTESQSNKLYTVVKGFSTAKGLYRTLYENRNRIIIFDDCDEVLKNDVAVNLLKGALDSYDERWISWNAEASFGDDLPRTFKFNGGVICITNMNVNKIDQAIRSRSIVVDVSMNMDQKIERMGAIITSDEFMPEFDFDRKKQALEFIDSIKGDLKELSLRELIKVTKVVGRSDRWQETAEYLLTAA